MLGAGAAKGGREGWVSEDFVGLGGRTIWDGMRELDQYVG